MGPSLYFLSISTASARSSGVKSINSPIEVPLRVYALGLEGMGWVGEYHSPGALPFSTFVSGIGHTGLPVMRSNTYSMPILDGFATALIALPLTLMSISKGAEDMS